MSKSDMQKNGPRLPWALVWPLGTVLLLSAVLLIAACSSDDPNAVGVGLVDTEIDALLEVLDLTELSSFRGIPIKDQEIPLWEQEVLYLGEQGGNASSILFQYDMDAVLNDTLSLEAFLASNINSVYLRLLMLPAFVHPNPEGTTVPEQSPWATDYEVYHREATIDPTLFPGAEPSLDEWDFVNPADTLNTEKLVNISIPAANLAGWMEAGGTHAFQIREGAGSGEGLVGYSSMDMKHAGSTLDPSVDHDVLGPALLVSLKEPEVTVVIPPTMDTSTFHALALEPVDPADGFFLRTCLRSYPALHFDFSSLPEDIFINRAVLTVVNDTTTSWGTLESIVISEMDPDLFGAEGDTLTLDDLAAAVYPVDGQFSLDPTYHYRMGFNVTTSVQRMINGVYEGTRGFILTPGEDFLPNFDTTTLDPDFYFNQFNFFGTAAVDTLRPRLMITYSVNETIQGGGK